VSVRSLVTAVASGSRGGPHTLAYPGPDLPSVRERQRVLLAARQLHDMRALQGRHELRLLLVEAMAEAQLALLVEAPRKHLTPVPVAT